MSVEGLHKLIMIMCSRGVEQLCSFLSTVEDGVKDSNEQEIIHHFIRHFHVTLRYQSLEVLKWCQNIIILHFEFKGTCTVNVSRIYREIVPLYWNECFEIT